MQVSRALDRVLIYFLLIGLCAGVALTGGIVSLLIYFLK